MFDLGCDGVQLVSVLAFYSDDLSLNPAESTIFILQNLFSENENEQKRAGDGPFKKRWKAFDFANGQKNSTAIFQDSYEICLAMAFGSLTGSFLSLNLSAGLIGPSRFTPYRSWLSSIARISSNNRRNNSNKFWRQIQTADQIMVLTRMSGKIFKS